MNSVLQSLSTPSLHPLSLTVSHQLQQSQVQRSFPPWVLVQGDAVARGGEHLPGADGHHLEEHRGTGLSVSRIICVHAAPLKTTQNVVFM